MNKEILKKKIAERLGLPETKKEFAFEVFVSRLRNSLDNNEALNVAAVGIFHLKKEPLPRQERISVDTASKSLKDVIYFIPYPEEVQSGSKTLFIRIDVNNEVYDSSSFDEQIFSLSFDQPLIPLEKNINLAQEGGPSLHLSTEEIADNIILESNRFENFDLWRDYIDNIKYSAKSDTGKIPAEKSIKPEDNIIDDSGDEVKFTDENIEWNWGDELKNVFTKEAAEEKPKEETPGPEVKGSLFDKLNESLIIEDEETETEDNVIENENNKESKISEEVIPAPSEPASTEKHSSLQDEMAKLDERINSLKRDIKNEKPLIEYGSGKKKKTEYKPKPKPEETIKQEKPAKEEFSEPKPLFTKPPEEFDIEPEDDKKFNYSYLAIPVAIILLVYLIFFWGGDEPSTQPIQPVRTEDTSGNSNQANRPSYIPDEENPETGNNISETKNNEPAVNNDKTQQTQQPASRQVQPPQETNRPVNGSNETRVTGLVYFNGSTYSKQVSSFKSKSTAEGEVQRLKRLGYEAYVVEAFIESKGGTWYRVRVGGFSTQQEAINFSLN